VVCSKLRARPCTYCSLASRRSRVGQSAQATEGSSSAGPPAIRGKRSVRRRSSYRRRRSLLYVRLPVTPLKDIRRGVLLGINL
jgi:hypothetical protein